MKKDTKQIMLEMGEWQRLRRIENAANWCVGWLSAGDLPDDVAMLTRLVEALEDNADLTGNQKLGKRCRINKRRYSVRLNEFSTTERKDQNANCN